MSWSEIKKKKEEEEKKNKSAKTSNSGISTVKNIIVGDLWKNVGQNIITSQKKAEERKRKEAETKKSTTKANNNNQFRVSQNVMPMSTSGSTYQRTIQPSTIKTTPVKYTSQKEIDKQKESATTWQKINDFINNSVSNVQSFENKVYDNVGNVMDKATDKTISGFRKIGSKANKTFKKSNAFDDGYQFGDVTKTAGSTIGNLGVSFAQGVAGIGTSIGKLASAGVAQIADWAGNKDYANRVRRKLATEEAPIDKGLREAKEYLNKNSIAGETLENMTTGVGQIAGYASATSLGLGGATMFGSSAGGAVPEAYKNENVISGQAWTKILGSGAIGQLSENLFGWFGKSGLDKGMADTIASKISSGLGKTLARAGVSATGEGAEEIIEYAGNQILDRLIDLASNGKGTKFAKDWDWDSAIDEALDAFGSSLLISGGQIASGTVQNKTNENTWTQAVNQYGMQQDIQSQLENLQNEAKDLQKKIDKEKNINKKNELKEELKWTEKQIESLSNTDVNTYSNNLQEIQKEKKANKDIDQEIKTSQNGFSQAEKTEALRQEARNKLESIKQNYDENSYNQMQEFIETAPSEKALNQVINDLNKEAETKQVAPLKQKQEVQLPMKQETQNKSFEDVAFEAMSNYESNEVESPLKNRDMDSIGKQTKVNAYQYDNPQVKPYFQEMAQQMGEDLAYISSSDNRSTQKGGGTKLSATTKAMDILHNEQGYSYNQIAQGLQNIIDDKGSENNAISKKIELVIDEQLRNGYTNALGKFVEPNQEYINNITEQYSLAEQAPQNNFKYEKKDNQKVNTLYESTSKYFDDSEKTHNMLKPMEKIVRDKGYNIVFDDTLGDNINGRIRTNQDTGETEITINPNSNRKGEFIIGHELTHAIETQEMVDLVKKRMEKDGELRNAVEDLKKLYGTDDINGEVLADISGQLFGNQEFINNLSVEKPSVFKRIYDKIISLANKITGNSNEALFIKDLKNKWEKAYRENNNNIREAQYSKSATNLPEVKEGYTRLYRGLESEYNPQYDKNKLDNVNGYESWTDDYDLAKSYGDNVYYIDIPTSEIKNSIIDEDSTSETYGDRNLIYKNDKPVGINGKNGNEYMLYTEHDNYKNIKYNKTNNQATAQDNQGNKLNPNMQKFMRESKAKVNSQGKISDNGDLAVVYHTTTDKVAQFNEFNPVGTPYYRFGDQVVNYYTDSKDMSGSYANQEYKQADTKRLNSIDDVNNYLNSLNKNNNNGNVYNLQKINNKDYVIETSEIDKKALNFLNSLSENELNQMKDSIYTDEKMKGTPYEKVFNWVNFDKELNNKYKKLTDEYNGTDNLVDIQKRMINYLENPNLYNENKAYNGNLVGSYDSDNEMFRNLKQDIQKTDWTNNSKIQYEGYVNITNPYIIDAEERNWNQVVQQSNDFIDELDERVPSDIKNKLVWLYVKSENLSSDLRAEYEKYQKTIEDIGNTASDFSDDTRHMNHLIRRLGLDEMNNLYEGNYNALKLNDWNVVADVLQTDGVIGSATANFITNEWRLPEQIKNWINTEYTKKLNLKDASNLKELYEKNAKAYEEFSKYRYPQDYFIEKISGDPDSEGFVNLGEELEEMFEERAEMMGADEVGRELAQAASVSFSKPELIRLWGTSKTTNDIVKEIIASNQDGKTNYDGLIIKNVYDYGGKSQSKEPANLYVTFNSNQFKAIDNENPTSDPDIRYSKQNQSWQDYLERNYKSEGTTTDLRDIRLPMKEKQEVKAPLKQGNVQQNQNNNTPGENINWNEIERPENNQKFRKHYRSIIESSNTTAEAKAVAKELMGRDTYEPETNKGQLAQADQRIMTSSPEAELQSLLSRSMNGEKISSVDIAVGERLIQYFSKTGSKQQLQEAIQATAMAGTSAGQTVQALSMLNHQTPQGQATWIQRSVDKMNKELAKKKGGTITTDADGNLQVINKQGKDITNKVDLFNLTPEMIDKIMNSENQEQMYKNIDEVYEELGQQVPKSMIEKIDTWRYFSMLANARTHIRNMVGNVAMGKMQRVKDKIAGGIEGVVSQFNPNMERTKTLARADKKTKNFAKQDFKNMEVQSRLELNENKYNPQSRLQNARRTFKSDVMENTLGRLFNLNDTLLEAEDGLGLKAGYQKALADYITANKIDVDNITDKQLNKARNYAIQQAKEATFHQANAIASAVTQFQNKNNVTKFFTDALLPFKKTPMNVAKAGMEYSPLQIAKSATVDLVNLRKGNISINQYIDNLSKGMTGTGIALAGYALAKAGILKASGGDDKDKEKYDEEQGKQSYSIQIAGKTYSLDWLAPTGIPLFIGAETHKLFNQEENEKGTEKRSEEDRLNQAIKGASNLLNAGATAINPMSEMSMISGLTSALSSYNTSDNLGSLGNMMTNMGKSYVNQFFPTLMGQVAKTGDEYERTTKSTAKGTIGKAVDQTINQIKNKVPGLRQTLPIKTDIWGKEVKQEVNLPLRAINNFINPATVKNVSTDKVDMELNKLYEENRNSALLPDILTKTVQLNKQTYRLSNKEYAEFTKNYGQTSHKLIENFIKTSDYNKLTQEQKETAISNIYSYAKEQNKLDYAKKVNETVKPSTLYTTMKEIEKNGGKQSEYLSYLAKTKGMSKESEKNKVLADSNYSNRTKEIIYTNGTGKDDNLYNNLLSKSHINMTEYLDYKDKVSNKAFSADKDKNGKTITGSAKAKVINYLNNNITGVGNRLLIAGKSYALQNNEKQKLAQYINSITNTREERIEIYKQLDKNFYVRNGKVYMRVSK